MLDLQRPTRVHLHNSGSLSSPPHPLHLSPPDTQNTRKRSDQGSQNTVSLSAPDRKRTHSYNVIKIHHSKYLDHPIIALLQSAGL